MAGRAWWRSMGVVLFFFLLTGIALSPLTLHLNSRVPGSAEPGGRVLDYYHFHWNLWWLKWAALHGENIWYTDRVLAPFTHNLTYHSLTASLLPPYLLLEPLAGHQRAANGILWISVALTGVLTYAVLRRFRISGFVALLGGTAVALSPYMLDHAASGHQNLLTVWWIPLALAAWDQTRLTRRVGWALITGLVLWGMWITDTLVIFWGGLLLGPYALYALWRAEDGRARGTVIVLGATALALTVGLSWVLGPLRQTLDFDTSQLPSARLLTLRHYSLSLDSLVMPGCGCVQNISTEHDETLGFSMIVLAWAAVIGGGLRAWRVRGRGGDSDRMARAVSREARRDNPPAVFWLLAALPALLLTLGPDVVIGGMRVPLPFRVIHELFNGQMRTPIRFLPPALVASVIFLARVYDPWLRRLRSFAVRGILAAGLLLGLLVDGGALNGIPTIPALKPYHFHEMMRAEHYPDYDYVVLDVPAGPFTGWRDLGSHPEAMVFGITHEKRMVSGLLSRIEIEQHLFYEKSALIGWLAGLRPLEPDRASVELNQFVAGWPVGYIVIHQGWLAADQVPEILAFFNAQTSLCFVEVERDAVLYRSTGHPKGCPSRTPHATAPGEYTLALGQPGDEGFIGHGWYGPEDIGGTVARWAGGVNEALLYADLPPGSGYEVTFYATAFAEARTVTVVAGNLVDGEPHVERLGELRVEPGGWREYRLDIPASLIDTVSGRLVFSLSADGLASAADLGLSPDPRPLTVAYAWVRLRAR